MDSLTLTWPGGENEFALRIGELRGLQGATDKGPEELFNALRLGTWRTDDIVQILRWGLMGGGMSKGDATDAVMRVFDLHPLTEFKLPALAIMAHALLGPMDDPVGEGEGVAETPPENGSSPSSTAPAQP